MTFKLFIFYLGAVSLFSGIIVVLFSRPLYGFIRTFLKWSFSVLGEGASKDVIQLFDSHSGEIMLRILALISVIQGLICLSIFAFLHWLR